MLSRIRDSDEPGLPIGQVNRVKSVDADAFIERSCLTRPTWPGSTPRKIGTLPDGAHLFRRAGRSPC